MSAHAVRRAAREAGLPERLAERVSTYAPAVVPPRGPAVVACDLDRTLVYSANALALKGADSEAPPLVVAEVYDGRPLSFCTRDSEAMLAALSRVAVLVPTTTRTREQFDRIDLHGASVRYAVTTNGGQLLVDGKPDPQWAELVAHTVAAGCAPLDEVLAHLRRAADADWCLKLRVAEDAFCYLVVDRVALPEGFLGELSTWCVQRGWTVSLQGRKLYCVPGPLTKVAAVTEVARRCGAVRVLASGDSLLDAEMLSMADEAVRPAHGELHDRDWREPHVAVTDAVGALAGEEVVARLLASVLAGLGGGST